MKALLSLAILSLASAASAQDFIRQIQTVEGATVIYDMPVTTDEGSVTSKPLTAETAIFQLYTTVTGTNNTKTLKKLDEKTVGTFLPQVTVTALSEDPYFPPRTRADKPYGLRIVISGMSTSATAPEYLKKLQVRRSYQLFNPTTYAATGTSGTYADSFTFRENGTFTDNAILQRLPGERPTKVVGQEAFTVYMHPDAGTVQSELGKATVTIWPVAEGSIQGIDAGKTYNDVPRAGSITLRDLYPKSITYAQIYKGKQATGSVGRPVPSTVLSYNTHAPQNAQLAISDLDNLVDDDGEYTIEVLTITPFNGGAPEYLGSVSFILNRTIRSNGAISTME
ncbi:hypothetical protein OKA04_08460 [Luteolibacter flavescens]|uniref:Uncharacterized protein n=1 Tax=Luteolibacter flavescens TaxID=1859460 RepID=A0ABT3FMH2_9BACT|nr:hypothetical protein [Luteolibacter flavescens]MCW1884758.1 hypothetical protein [Luteolibacter flavescens]